MPPTQVLAQCDLQLGSRQGLKIFKMAILGAHLRYQTLTILAILNLYVTPMLPSSLGSIRITVWKEMLFKDLKMAAILDVGMELI